MSTVYNQSSPTDVQKNEITHKQVSLKDLLISSLVAYLLLGHPPQVRGMSESASSSPSAPYNSSKICFRNSSLSTTSLPFFHTMQNPFSFYEQHTSSLPTKIKQKNFTFDDLNRLDKATKRDSNFLKKLLDEGMDINATNPEGLSLLHMAVKANKKKLVWQLLEHKADVNVVTQGKALSPLHIAVQTNNKDLVKLLLEYHANIDAQSYRGLTPLDIAVKTQNKDLILFLLDRGADINHPISSHNYYGDTPLAIAIKKNDPSITKLLLQKGANANHMIGIEDGINLFAPVINRVSLLHFAIANNYNEIVELLLQYKAEIEKKEPNAQRTPLHWACQYQNYPAVQLLLQYYADICATDLGGFTPDELTSDETIRSILTKNKNCPLKNPDQSKPNSLYIRAQHDYNGALRTQEALSFAKSISTSYNNKKATISSFKQLIDTLNQHPEESLDLLVIHAHGQPNNITLSKNFTYTVQPFFTDLELQKALKALKPNATIILFSCLTAQKAKGENVADFFLRHAPSGVTIFAPSEIAYSASISQTPNDTQKIKVEFGCKNQNNILENLPCTVRKIHNLFLDWTHYLKSKLFHPFS